MVQACCTSGNTSIVFKERIVHRLVLHLVEWIVFDLDIRSDIAASSPIVITFLASKDGNSNESKCSKSDTRNNSSSNLDCCGKIFKEVAITDTLVGSDVTVALLGGSTYFGRDNVTKGSIAVANHARGNHWRSKVCKVTSRGNVASVYRARILITAHRSRVKTSSYSIASIVRACISVIAADQRE